MKGPTNQFVDFSSTPTFDPKSSLSVKVQMLRSRLSLIYVFICPQSLQSRHSHIPSLFLSLTHESSSEDRILLVSTYARRYAAVSFQSSHSSVYTDRSFPILNDRTCRTVYLHVTASADRWLRMVKDGSVRHRLVGMKRAMVAL